MRAAVLRGPGKLVVEEVPTPKPRKGEVLIRMRLCGICGSDLHYYESNLTPPGSIMGHEWVGVVVELGEEVTKWQIGDRVWPGTLHTPGWQWRPEYGWDLHARLLGASAANMGGYGEFAVYHQDSIVAVPEEVTDIEAVMADQAATALGGIRAVQLQSGEGAFVVGAGPIGLWSLRCAQLAGASSTCVAEVLPGRGAHARDMGADLVVDSRYPVARDKIAAFFDGAGPDVILECAGTESGFQLALDVARPEGRIGAIGLSFDPIRINSWPMVIKALNVYGVIDIDFPGGMEIIRQGKVDCSAFLTELIPLGRVPQAFQMLLNPVDEEKIVIRFD